MDDDIRSYAASSLGEIDPGNENAIATLVQLLESNQFVPGFPRREIASSLGEIDPGNEIAINALVKLLLQSYTLGNRDREQVVSSLEKIDPGNKIAIATLVQLLQLTIVDMADLETASNAKYSLWEIGAGNEFAIAALVQLLQSSSVEDCTRWQAAESLGKIGTGNEFAIAALVQLLQSTTVDDSIRRKVAESLGEILQVNKHRFYSSFHVFRPQSCFFFSSFASLRGSRSWGKPRQLLMGETPKTALAPQDRAALSLREIKIVWFIYLKIAVK